MAIKKGIPSKIGGLNAKQSRFVDEYLIDLNATQAAVRAGYSPRTAQQQGSRLLLDAVIKANLSEKMAKREARTEIKQDRVLQEIALSAFLDPADLFAADGTLLPLDRMPESARRAIAGLEVEETFKGEGKNREWTGYLKKIKLVSKEGTLTLAARHLGMLRDKTELTGPEGGPMVVRLTKDDEKL